MNGETIKKAILDCGASGVGSFTGDAPTDRAFRDACAVNSCGKYGKCWTCPPDIGDIDTLMATLKSYRNVIVYQLISPLEDSFDFEGMVAAKKDFFALTKRVGKALSSLSAEKYLHLGAGGCGVCEKCAKEENLPCRHPSQAISSLEAYGVNVSLLAKKAGLNYINGPDTVTYFGAIFY